MNGQVTSVAPVRPRSTTLAFAAIAAWLAAAAITGPIGIRPAIGGAAIALGLSVLLFERPASTALLQPSPRLVLLGVVILGEELVWRGVVQGSLVQRLGAWRGVALAAVVYGLGRARAIFQTQTASRRDEDPLVPKPLQQCY